MMRHAKNNLGPKALPLSHSRRERPVCQTAFRPAGASGGGRGRNEQIHPEGSLHVADHSKLEIEHPEMEWRYAL